MTTNLALPGFGTLLAGRVVGYPQVILGLAGMVLTVIFGIHFLIWTLSNWSQIRGADSDPAQTLIDLYLNVRWAVLGIFVFACGWVWALISSFDILMDSRRKPSQPPVLGSRRR